MLLSHKRKANSLLEAPNFPQRVGYLCTRILTCLARRPQNLFNYGEFIMRPLSKVAPAWWDYTTLDRAILDDAARLSAEELLQLGRPGFTIKVYETLEDFYLAEALEYITAWK